MNPAHLKNLPSNSAKNSEPEAPAKAGFQSFSDYLNPEVTHSHQASGSGCSAIPEIVEMIKEEGHVRRLKVRCACGEVIELDFDYTE